MRIKELELDQLLVRRVLGYGYLYDFLLFMYKQIHGSSGIGIEIGMRY